MPKNPIGFNLIIVLAVFIFGSLMPGCSPLGRVIPSPTTIRSTTLEPTVFQTSIPTETAIPTPTPPIEPEIININNANRLQLINQTTIEGELLVPSIVNDMLIFYQGNRIFSKTLPDFKDGFALESTVDLTYHNLDGSVSPDGQILAWYHYDKYRHSSGKMEVWRIDQESGTFIGKVLDYDGTYKSSSIDTFNFGFMDDNKSLVVLQQEDFGQHFTIHNTNNLNDLPRVIKLPDPYWYVVTSPHFRYAVSFLPEGHADTIKILDLITGSSACWGSQDHEGLTAVEFSPEEDFLVAFDNSAFPSIKFKSIPECSAFQKFDWDKGFISKFYISPDQTLMGIVAHTYSEPSHLYMWDLVENRILYDLPDVDSPYDDSSPGGDLSAFSNGVFSPGGDLFAFSNGAFNRISLINTYDGSLLFSQEVNGRGIAFSPDGYWLITGIGSNNYVFGIR
jgi:hypothetical protein